MYMCLGNATRDNRYLYNAFKKTQHRSAYVEKRHSLGSVCPSVPRKRKWGAAGEGYQLPTEIHFGGTSLSHFKIRRGGGWVSLPITWAHGSGIHLLPNRMFLLHHSILQGHHQGNGVKYRSLLAQS